MGRYHDPIHHARPGQEYYPTNSSRSSRPRPKSLVMGSEADLVRMKKYKSVVTLKSDHQYQRVVPIQRTSKAATSPTHEALIRRRLSSYNNDPIEMPSKMMTTSEYFSHSSESDA